MATLIVDLLPDNVFQEFNCTMKKSQSVPLKDEKIDNSHLSTEAIILEDEDVPFPISMTKKTTSSSVKTELQRNNFESELSSPACKQKSESIMHIKKLKVFEESEDDSLFRDFDTALVRYQNLCSELQVESLENENSEGIPEEERKIKQEVMDIQEDFESNQVGTSPSCCYQDHQENSTNNQCNTRSVWNKSRRNEVIDQTRPLQDYILSCALCDFQTEHKSSLNDHLLCHKQANEVDILKCSQCSYQTVRKNNFKRHSIVHKKLEGAHMLKCAHCEFQTKHKRSLERHLLQHKKSSKVDMFKCDQCCYQTPRKSDLKQHYIKHQNPEELNRFKCNQCNFQTIYKSYIKQHLMIHKNPDNVVMFQCTSCDFQTKYKKSLKWHLLLHKNDNGINILKCDQCSFQTIYKRNLKRHSIKHTNLRKVVS